MINTSESGKMKTKLSFYWRATLSAILVLSFSVTTVRAQDISGGAGALLASADVEAKLGKGIFSTPPNKAHAPKHFEKKTVARPARAAAHPQRQTTASGRQETARVTKPPRTADSTKPRNESSKPRVESSKPRVESSKPRTESSKPPDEPAKHVLTAEEYNRQGDDFFDAGQYEKAAASYQQAVHLQPNYPEAYLNLGETYFNLARYDEAIAADKQAIQQKANWGAAYHAL